MRPSLLLHSKAIPAAVLVLTALLALLAACGGSGKQAQPTPTVTVTTTPGASSAPAPPTGPAVSPSQSGQAPDTNQSQAIWEQILGHKLDEPALAPYRGLDIQSQGIKVEADGSDTVTSVTLFNDEAALGYEVSGSTYSAYKGVLPGGLDWSNTDSDVINQMGPPTQAYTAGWGVAENFTYQNYKDSGFNIYIEFQANMQREEGSSPIHFIRVQQAG